MKMLGARGREGIKRYRRRNERFLRNEIPYFQEIIQTTFQKVETYTNRRTEPTHGRETDGSRQTRKPGPRARHPAESSDMSRRAGPGQPRSCTATHRPGRRERGTKGPKSQSRSLARMSASATPTPNYQDDSKFFTKKTRSDSMSAPGPRDTKQTASLPRASTPVPRHPESEGYWDRRAHHQATTRGKMNGTHRPKRTRKT